MQERPLSDRRHHRPGEMSWEVRAWSEPSGHRSDVDGWRSVGWSAERGDAVALASALVTAPDRLYSYAEVWGPSGTSEEGCERFPAPDAEERRAMWLRAADEHYASGYVRQPASSL